MFMISLIKTYNGLIIHKMKNSQILTILIIYKNMKPNKLVIIIKRIQKIKII